MTLATKAQIDEALDYAIALRGADYVYPPAMSGETCTYSNPDGSPSCIVGVVVNTVNQTYYDVAVKIEAHDGNSTGALEYLRGDWRGGEYNSGSGEYEYELESEFTDLDLASALVVAQAAQDAGLPWGVARDFYHAFLAIPSAVRPLPYVYTTDVVIPKANERKRLLAVKKMEAGK